MNFSCGAISLTEKLLSFSNLSAFLKHKVIFTAPYSRMALTTSLKKTNVRLLAAEMIIVRRLYRVYPVSAGVQVYFYNCDYTIGAGARSVGQQFKVISIRDQKALLLQL